MVRRREDSGDSVTWSDAVNWYLEENEDSIGSSTSELEKRRKLANSIVKKLVRHDAVLVFLTEKVEGEGDEGRDIGVHPNYSIDG